MIHLNEDEIDSIDTFLTFGNFRFLFAHTKPSLKINLPNIIRSNVKGKN